MGVDEGEARETVELSLTVPKCMLRELEDDMPLVKSPQDRVVMAVQYYLAEDQPATAGDVNHEVRHAFKSLMDDIYPADVMERQDQLEEKMDSVLRRLDDLESECPATEATFGTEPASTDD